MSRFAPPGWHIGGSSGNWHAFRSGVSMLDDPWSLLRRHLHAETLVGLAERLDLQDYLDSPNEQELTEVWQRVKLPEHTDQLPHERRDRHRRPDDSADPRAARTRA